MPYEATVPVHRRLLWPAVTDAERLIGALPNASIDASGAQGVAGRLRVRTREQTVTFRGVARIVNVVPSSLRVSIEVEAVFGRTGGTVEGVVEIALRQSGSGTRVVVGGQLDIAPGSVPLPAEALDIAFQRVVQRWFTALAETSPAAKPAAAEERAERRELPGSASESPATEPRSESGTDLPRRRKSERAPLAVVRDVPADQEKQGNGKAAPVRVPQPAAPEAEGSNGWSKPVPDQADDDAAAEAQSAESDSATPRAPASPSPAPLRLVTPEPQTSPVVDEVAEPEAAETDRAQAAVVAEERNEPAEPEPDDIWSRLRDRSLPPWIPFLIGAGTATLAALAFVLAALRRRYRR